MQMRTMQIRHFGWISLMTVLLAGADQCGTNPYDCESEAATGFLSADAATTGRYVVRIDPQRVAETLDGVVATDVMALATALGAQEIELIDYSNDMFTCTFANRKEAKAAAKIRGVLYVQEERTLSIPEPVTPRDSDEAPADDDAGPGADAVDGDYSWGIDRLNERRRRLDGNTLATVRFAGEKHVIVIDTGVDERHEEFAGRIGECHTTVPGSSSCRDGHGHGTHVAGTIAGDDFGVCKECIVHYCRALDDSGRGSDSSVIGCLNWARDLAARLGGIKVINMSLGGDTSRAFDDAVCGAIRDGIHVVVAAGNASENACGSSPAHVQQAVTVYATDDDDDIAWFSNDGRCTDIAAPGVEIRSASRGESGSAILSGTSMSSPHVAGTVAIYGSEKDVIANATPDVVDGQLHGSPNLLAYDGEE